jgi:hypothetical protein
MTMQIDRDAVIAAIEGEFRRPMTAARQNPRLCDVVSAIHALPASNARIEAGEAMKVACLGYLYAHECSDEILRAIQSLNTADIVGDGV